MKNEEGYTKKSEKKYEFIIYSIISCLVVSFICFNIFLSRIFKLNNIFTLDFLITKSVMSICFAIIIVFLFYYTFIINKISMEECTPGKYPVHVLLSSKCFLPLIHIIKS